MIQLVYPKDFPDEAKVILEDSLLKVMSREQSQLVLPVNVFLKGIK